MALPNKLDKSLSHMFGLVWIHGSLKFVCFRTYPESLKTKIFRYTLFLFLLTFCRLKVSFHLVILSQWILKTLHLRKIMTCISRHWKMELQGKKSLNEVLLPSNSRAWYLYFQNIKRDCCRLAAVLKFQIFGWLISEFGWREKRKQNCQSLWILGKHHKFASFIFIYLQFHSEVRSKFVHCFLVAEKRAKAVIKDREKAREIRKY